MSDSPSGSTEVEYGSMYEPSLEIEQYSIMWGLASMGMAGLSSYYYNEYTNKIWNDNKYPYRYQNVDAYDKDWALSTKELSAWNNTVWGMNLLHGMGLVLWLANWLFDNEGGAVHYIFYRYVQFSYITPVIDLLLTLNVVRAYVQGM